MSSKGLKPAIIRPSARSVLAIADIIAQEAGIPPATLAPRVPLPVAIEDVVQLNIRVQRTLGDQLADRARAEGTTQKALICQALAEVGFRVAESDLRGGPIPRRRGSQNR